MLTCQALLHGADAAAYVKTFHPDWSPSMITSALMTTGNSFSPSLNISQIVGGWTQGYDGLTFASVRGAGHEVALHRPQLAFLLVKAFLSGTTMPIMPQVITDY
ncbi:hypothetical protein GIB67_032669 [Kingdonia uniflora]|uniref:Uncharacterized protein n=1 Tax=Kingdonia uniflora TaxID=39325 RepID=A0A7J7MW87_9MAGN|nr:hypothetical protein GIB67_032669 [Kingdonia uniflora]